MTSSQKFFTNKPSNFLGRFPLKKDKPLRIYGAGFSGLVFGYFAHRAGYQVEIHEKSKREGGLIQLEETTWGYVDSAAHTLLISPKVQELLNQLKLQPEFFPEKTKRFLVKEGSEFQGYPVGLSDFPQILAKGLKRIPAQALSPNASVADFFIPWIGEKLTNQVVSTALSGIYATSAHELNFVSIFEPPLNNERYLQWAKRLIGKIKKNKTRSASFPKGMAELPQALAQHLAQFIQYKSSPLLDEKNFYNVICTNAHDAASIILASYPQASERLSSISYQNLYKNCLFLDQPINELNQAFGALLSHESSFKSMGIINTSHLFPERTFQKQAFQYSFIYRDPKAVIHDLKILGLNEKNILFEKVFFWEKAIPLYNNTLRLALTDLSKNPFKATSFYGNYTGEISLRKLIEKLVD